MIVTGANPVIGVVKQATSTIPVVMGISRDPVGAGFIASHARPGGNITGLAADPVPEVLGKEVVASTGCASDGGLELGCGHGRIEPMTAYAPLAGVPGTGSRCRRRPGRGSGTRRPHSSRGGASFRPARGP